MKLGAFLTSALWRLRLPPLRTLSRFGDLGRFHLFGEVIAMESGASMSISCRQGVPHVSLD
jgi:hypothetical protein